MKNNTVLAFLLLSIATMSWGGNVIIGRAMRSEMPPLGMSFWRWALCCLILLLFTAPRVTTAFPIIRREWKLLLVMSVFGIAAYNTLQYVALHTTTAINVTLIMATCPAIMALFSVLFLKDQLGWAQIAGIVVSFVGVAIVITSGDLLSLMSVQFAVGDLWMLVAAIVWAIYSIAIKKRPADLDPLVMLTVITGAGALMLLPLYLWESMTVMVMPVTVKSLLTVGYISLVASLFAFICYNKGVSLIGPAKAGVSIHLLPVWVAIFAYIFLGERLQSFHLMGIALIATGILLNSRKTS